MQSLVDALKSSSSLVADGEGSGSSPDEPSPSDDAFDGFADCLGIPDAKREEAKELLRVLILETRD